MLLAYLPLRRMILKATSIPIPIVCALLILLRVVDSFVSDIQPRRQASTRIVSSLSHISSKLEMATKKDDDIEGPSHVENVLFIECGMSNFTNVWQYGSLLIRIYTCFLSYLNPAHSASFSFSPSFLSKYFILLIGFGNDSHGQNATKAAGTYFFCWILHIIWYRTYVR